MGPGLRIDTIIADETTFRHGPVFEPDGVRFRLWAPAQERVELTFEHGPAAVAMHPGPAGFHEALVPGLRVGAKYRFRLADGRRVPDPASRFQPDDVDGPSELVDHRAYRWSEPWAGREWLDVVLYELHVGCFTREGTFAAAAGRLDHLAELGVTAVELMPLGDFPGRRNWGYDGAYPYAPDSSYGRPNDLKAFVEAAHARGIAVLLDVVYNHFGPRGNYLSIYAPDFFNARRKTPWGDAVNFDGPNSGPVRAFFIENALYWLETFHLDGLRLDAVHAIHDDSHPGILEELAAAVRARFERPIHLLLENEDNEPGLLRHDDRRPRHYTAQWNDDVHHVLHVAATGESQGYYSAYGEARLLGRALGEGFAYQGELMAYRDAPRGGPSSDLPPSAFVGFIQNHDQIGNRAFGQRLDKLTSLEAMRALASVYLLLPQIPMLFMGEEWGSTRPFLFFCDFDGDLAEAVRKGRREEFRRFPEYADPARAAMIPDPLDEATFLACKLDWVAIDAEKLAFHRSLLRARREHVRPLLADIERGGEWRVLGEQAVTVVWDAGARRLVLDANLSDRSIEAPPERGAVFWRLGETERALGPWSARWSVVGT